MAIGEDGTGEVNGYYIGPGADLRGATLASADLSRVNLAGANLSGCSLTYSNLNGANLAGANLDGSSIVSSSLIKASLKGASLKKAVFQDCHLAWANLQGANLSNASLAKLNLSEADFEGANLNSANLRGSILYKADFFLADLTRANLSYTDLTKATMSSACLANANLEGVRLEGVTFFNCCLDNINLSEAYCLKNADSDYFTLSKSIIFINSSLKNANMRSGVLGESLFFGTDLSGANFTLSDLEGATFSDDPSLLMIHRAFSFIKLKELHLERSAPEIFKKYKNKKYKNNLKNVSFIKANLNLATFVDLSVDANFKKASLLGASFVDCDLTKSTNLDERQSARFIFEGDTKGPQGFTMSDYIDVNGHKVGPGMDLRGADLHDVNLAGAVLDGANLSKANLTGADLSYSRMNKTNLSNADLSDSFAKSTKINKSNLTGAKLKSSIFTDSDVAYSNLSKISAPHIEITNSDLNNNNFRHADLAGSHLSNINLNKNKLDNTSFANSSIINSEFKDNEYNNVSFKNTAFTGSYFNERDLADSDFRKARIDSSFFGSPAGAPTDLRRTKFKNAKFYGDKPNTIPYLMSEDLLKISASDIEKAKAEIDAKIESHPYYLGRRHGLWIHMTRHPKLDYFGELCVSPYEEGEHTAGGRGYGVIFEGEAPLFKTDVFSEKTNFGFLAPSTPLSDDLSTHYKYKEGFLDTQAAKIVQLNVMGNQGSLSIIKKFKDRGIPVKIFNRGVEVPPREPNPSCRVCGQHASLVSRSGAPICEDCY